MSFILGQYNKNFDTEVKAATHKDNELYMSLLKGGTPKRKKKVYNNNVFNDSGLDFFDECVQTHEILESGLNYYFHCKIKQMETSQKFDIKLIKYDDINSDEQYIKTIDILGGEGWIDIEFIFTPAANFDTILFELVRTTTDYQVGVRYPIILYQELSKINNIITSEIGVGVSLVKIGVQSHPGLMMCINGEQILIGRTGVYELRNGIINVSKFSVVNAATEKESIDALLKELANLEASAENIVSKCIFDTEKNRSIDAFTLDYMYERGV